MPGVAVAVIVEPGMPCRKAAADARAFLVHGLGETEALVCFVHDVSIARRGPSARAAAASVLQHDRAGFHLSEAYGTRQGESRHER